MGATYNSVSRWELGTSEATWRDFCKLCDVCKIDLKGAVALGWGFLRPPASVSELVTHIQGAIPAKTLCEAIGVSRSTWSRWQLGKGEPTLREMLSLMSINRGLLVCFLENLVDPASLPCFASEFDMARRFIDAVAAHPGALCLRDALELSSYRELSEHRPGVIAQSLGISVDEEELILGAFAKVGLIRRNCGKWEHSIPEVVIRKKGSALAAIRGYWLGRLIEYLKSIDKTPTHKRFGVNVFATSESAAAKIQAEVASFFRRVEAIRAEDKGVKDSVRVIWFQVMDLAALKPD